MNYKEALEKIADICSSARQVPTIRQARIHDIALKALGLTESQRKKELEAVRESAMQHIEDKRAKFNHKDGDANHE